MAAPSGGVGPQHVGVATGVGVVGCCGAVAGRTGC